jgi:hypothetical protein
MKFLADVPLSFPLVLDNDVSVTQWQLAGRADSELAVTGRMPTKI